MILLVAVSVLSSSKAYWLPFWNNSSIVAGMKRELVEELNVGADSLFDYLHHCICAHDV